MQKIFSRAIGIVARKEQIRLALPALKDKAQINDIRCI